MEIILNETKQDSVHFITDKITITFSPSELRAVSDAMFHPSHNNNDLIKHIL